jgi:uncharacterized RDD family membrane protein YckC
MEEITQPLEGERAGAVTRFAAFLVDDVILAVGLHTANWILRALPRVLGRFAPPVNLDHLFLAIAPFVVGAYFLVFWTVLGQTPGKWLMGVKIVRVAGGRLTFRRSLVRLVGYLFSALPFYLGFLWILGPSRRGWHDLLAGTDVVYVRRRVEAKGMRAPAVGPRIREIVTRPASYRLPARPSGSGSRP